jgi:hypothetical protein
MSGTVASTALTLSGALAALMAMGAGACLLKAYAFPSAGADQGSSRRLRRLGAILAGTAFFFFFVAIVSGALIMRWS